MSLQQSILSHKVVDKDELYRLYMPFVKGGGMFIPTSKELMLGDDVFVVINYVEDEKELAFTGSVVWITPLGSQGSKRPGVGVQFANNSDGESTRSYIEKQLSGLLNRDVRTDTL